MSAGTAPIIPQYIQGRWKQVDESFKKKKNQSTWVTGLGKMCSSECDYAAIVK